MTKDRVYQALMALAIVAGIAGVPLVTQTGCETLYVRDAETGEIREATLEEDLELRTKMIGDVVDQTSVVLAATGHPEYIPFVRLGGQLACALTALFINKKRNGLPAPKKKQ